MSPSPSYQLSGQDFILSQYNQAEPFASFLPGIAGETGRPLWVFYTNRGQAVSSFGIQDKDHAMLEFQPANRAYQRTALEGFRTFVQMGNNPVYEPFSPALRDPKIKQQMIVRPHEIELQDFYPALGLQTTVAVFTVPHEKFPFLARLVEFTNTSSQDKSFRFWDGLAQVVPYGLNEWLSKHMSRTMEAFMQVLGKEKHLPFYQLKMEPSDTADIKKITGGFLAFGVADGKLLSACVHPATLFGPDTSLLTPEKLPGGKAEELTQCATPCAFFGRQITLKKKSAYRFLTLFGYAGDWLGAQNFAKKVVREDSYGLRKRRENAKLIQEITDSFALHTGDPRLNFYHHQSFLDNVLRGGLPKIVSDKGTAFHLYSRKHGDMERDYNQFQLLPSAYSQGNGNFRDVNQNRRSELFLEPALGPVNVEMFFNLIQLDGYNPLVILMERFKIQGSGWETVLTGLPAGSAETVRKLFAKAFTPGELYEALQEQPVGQRQTVVEQILAHCKKETEAKHGEGFWIDHWTYNLDLLENYAAVYPDKLRWLLLDKNDFWFYDNDHVVQPRDRKYLIKDSRPVQLHAVVQDPEKRAMLESRTTHPHLMRQDSGRGEIFKTTLLVKLLCLIANKMAVLDPYGMGIEMEADKPGWCDSLNGLPSLFGSSACETLELKRLVDWLLQELPRCFEDGETILVHHQIQWLVEHTSAVLSKRTGNWFATWDALHHALEQFRQTNKMGLSGRDIVRIPLAEVMDYLQVYASVLKESAARLKNPHTKMVTTYFSYQPTIKSTQGALVEVTGFEQNPLPYFLEGPVHALKLSNSLSEARALREAVRKTELWDRKLGLYRVNVPLDKAPYEIGRSRIFTPGWLENESIFLHMHYKWLLEELKSGLLEEFFEDLKTGLVAFHKPERYKRSPYENSSFLVSSRFPDLAKVGQGFVARLSGATAEWMNMVLVMVLGQRPFRLIQGKLVFQPEPVLPGWMFAKKAEEGFPKDSLALRCLGGTWVVYHNPLRRNTFGKTAVTPQQFILIKKDGSQQTVDAGRLGEPEALSLRQGLYQQLHIHLE